ncbi:carboxypeptidase regulatory-like domain-containing protein [Balneola sp. MJW-20]|uniref:TonB-dependent receptor n=1 Tax=Gracilimonas aurantiaca TaxID=3234185 RepID=UPI00346753E3
MPAFAGTTGKIAGTVVDESGEPLPGVQIFIVGTSKGTISDVDGKYSLVNLKPGKYIVEFRFLGFATYRVENVEVIVDKTTTIDATLREAVIEGEEVVVVAERPIVEADRTTTTSYISSEQLENLPIVSVDEAVNQQAGVVDGHFRGGRLGEVAYLVNGVPINNAFNNSASFEVEQNMVSSLQVISGVFNAEYGQALSGVVNIVTKGVSRDWSGSFLGYVGGYASTREFELVDRISDPGNFLTINDFENEKVNYFEAANPIGTQDYQFSVSGPIIKEKLGVQASLRYFTQEGHLIGRNLFQPSDLSFNVNNGPPSSWVISSTGDGDFEAVNFNDRASLNASLIFEASSRLKIDYNIFLQDLQGRNYDHGYKYNPDGINNYYGFTQTHILGTRYTLGSKTFANLSYSYLRDEGEFKLYDDPTDSRYEPVSRSATSGEYGFLLGGNYLFSSRDLTETHTVVGDITSQLTNEIQVKTGFSMRRHAIDNNSAGILVDELTNEVIPTSNPFQNNALEANPIEAAIYGQTKIELNQFIINAGLRLDYFDTDYEVANRYDIPDANGDGFLDETYTINGETFSNRRKADTKLYLSPRLGVAFPISKQGVLRFSAGLFYQNPQLQFVYANPNFQIDNASSQINFGNANLDPERTLAFEVGLQQALNEDLGMDLTVFSKDIRNLTTVEFITNNPVPRGRNVNIDYATIKGVTLSLYQRSNGPLNWNIDYTLQFATGSASDPSETFQRRIAGLDPVIRLRRLNWDRRNVLNASLTWTTDVGLTFSTLNTLRTGTPYTTVRNDSRSFINNNEDRPLIFNTDLRTYYNPPFIKQNVQLFLQVDNVFDIMPDFNVYNDTGLATESVQAERDIRAGAFARGINTIDEFVLDRSRVGAPRIIQIGLSYKF